MKKLAAILMSCMLITSAFVSCGDKDDSSSSKTGTTKASAEASSADEETTDDGEADTTEGTSEEKTTAAEKTTKAEKTASGETVSGEKTTSDINDLTFPEVTEAETIDTSQLKGGDVLGKWVANEFVTEYYEFKPDGVLELSVDMGAFMTITKDKMSIMGEEYEVKYDGNNLEAYEEGEVMMKLHKVSGSNSPDDIDGTYSEEDADATLVGSAGLIEIKNGGVSIISQGASYKIDGNKITLTAPAGEGDDVEELFYEVNGDKLTFVDADYPDDVTELNRVK